MTTQCLKPAPSHHHCGVYTTSTGIARLFIQYTSINDIIYIYSIAIVTVFPGIFIHIPIIYFHCIPIKLPSRLKKIRHSHNIKAYFTHVKHQISGISTYPYIMYSSSIISYIWIIDGVNVSKYAIQLQGAHDSTWDIIPSSYY